jgi:tetratricopeptide (TPR) repeat protein
LALALARDAVNLLRERAKQVNDPSLLLAGLIVISSCSFKERRFQQALAAADELLDLGAKHSLSLAICERLQEAAVVKMMSLAQLDRLQEAKDQGEILIEAMETQGKYSERLLEPLCQLATVYERIGSRDKASRCLDQALLLSAISLKNRLPALALLRLVLLVPIRRPCLSKSIKCSIGSLRPISFKANLSMLSSFILLQCGRVTQLMWPRRLISSTC